MAKKYITVQSGGTWTYRVAEADGTVIYTSTTLHATQALARAEMEGAFGEAEHPEWIEFYRQNTAPSPIPETLALWEDSDSVPTQVYAALDDDAGTRLWSRLSLIESNAFSPEIVDLVVLAPVDGYPSLKFKAGPDTIAAIFASTTTFDMAFLGASFLLVDSATGRIDLTGALSVSAGLASSPAIARIGGTLSQSTTQVGNTALTETSLWSYSVPASTLGTNGDSLTMWIGGVFGATVSLDKRIIVKFGSTEIFNSGALTGAQSQEWRVECNIIRTGAATQKAICSLSTSGVPTGVNYVDYTTPTATLSGAVTLDVRGNGTNASDTVFQLGKVSWEPGV